MSYYDNGFARAQQLYDQQEPRLPDFGDECMEYGLLLGDDDGSIIGKEVVCAHCPMKHRCRDGIRIISFAKNDAAEAKAFEEYKRQMQE